MLKRSGAIVSALSALSTLAWASPSSARMRRCSTSARAIGFANGRSGRRNSNPAHGRCAGVVDDEAALLGAFGADGLRAGGRLGKPAARHHVEVDAGGADHQ